MESINNHIGIYINIHIVHGIYEECDADAKKT